jgi:hypothetical protein
VKRCHDTITQDEVIMAAKRSRPPLTVRRSPGYSVSASAPWGVR